MNQINCFKQVKLEEISGEKLEKFSKAYWGKT